MLFEVDIYRRAAEAEMALNAAPRDPTDNEVEAADALYRAACEHVPCGARETSEKAALMSLVEGDTMEPVLRVSLKAIAAVQADAH